MSRQSGFTLIEMAFVIAIVGLMVGGGLMAIGPVIEKTRITQTNSTFDQIENALVLYAIRNNRLPCPADGSMNNANALYGLEIVPLTAPGTATSACTVATANSVIPWRTLGMDESYSVDGWNNRVSYFPASGQIIGVNTLADNTSSPTCAAGANCTLCLSRTNGVSGSSTRASFCDIASTPLNLSPSYPYGNYIAVYVAANPYGTELTTSNRLVGITAANVAQFGGRAAYVLISHGKSGWYGWNKAGIQIAPPATTYLVKKYNSNGSAGSGGNLGFVQGSPVLINGSPAYFDDIVRWRSPAFLIQSCGSGSCGNP